MRGRAPSPAPTRESDPRTRRAPCDKACDNPCNVCSVAAGASVDGVCVPAPPGAQTSTCNSLQACSGADSACATGCVMDGDCAPTFYCAKDSKCTACKRLAAKCDASAGADCKNEGRRVCGTNNCVDGFCCSRLRRAPTRCQVSSKLPAKEATRAPGAPPVGNVRSEPFGALYAKLRARKADVSRCQECWTACRGFRQAQGGGGSLAAWGELGRRMRPY